MRPFPIKQAPKAGGDMKIRGRPDPYAFVPLNPQMLNRRSKHSAVRQFEGVVKATGRRIRDLEMHLWTFAPDGKVARFRHVVDTHQHVTAYRGA